MKGWIQSAFVIPIVFKYYSKSSGHQQRRPPALSRAILIPPAPLVVADFSLIFMQNSGMNLLGGGQNCLLCKIESQYGEPIDTEKSD